MLLLRRGPPTSGPLAAAPWRAGASAAPPPPPAKEAAESRAGSIEAPACSAASDRQALSASSAARLRHGGVARYRIAGRCPSQRPPHRCADASGSRRLAVYMGRCIKSSARTRTMSRRYMLHPGDIVVAAHDMSTLPSDVCTDKIGTLRGVIQHTGTSEEALHVRLGDEYVGCVRQGRKWCHGRHRPKSAVLASPCVSMDCARLGACLAAADATAGCTVPREG